MLNKAEFHSRLNAIPHDRTLGLLRRAGEAASSFQHTHIGSEHLLLGILADELDARPLEILGITHLKAEYAVEFIMGKGDQQDGKVTDFTPRAIRVLKNSVKEAKELKDETVEPNHVILGLVREEDYRGIESGVLEHFGVSPSRVRTSVLEERRRRLTLQEQQPVFSTSPALNRLRDLVDIELTDDKLKAELENLLLSVVNIVAERQS
jgi:ATP-dependent Clp protease ATP-binding subunit ClpC